jgi:hypothetical protein
MRPKSDWNSVLAKLSTAALCFAYIKSSPDPLIDKVGDSTLGRAQRACLFASSGIVELFQYGNSFGITEAKCSLKTHSSPRYVTRLEVCLSQV